MTDAVVEVEDLRIDVAGSGVYIVDDVNLAIAPGEVVGLVGESGSGKTTLGLALLGHTRRGAQIVHGRVRIEGHDVVDATAVALRSLWGRKVAYVPQDPRAAINPSLRIGVQIEEILDTHGFGVSKADRQQRILETLDEVLLPSDHAFLRRYPHQLSGGQLQRVALAMAFACRPRVIVFDEPTTGLDVTTQAHVLRTIRTLCREHRVGALYVTHDLAVVATLAARVGVMYSGRLVELGSASAVFERASHPYTRRLVEAAPEASGRHALVGIAGSAPRPGHRPDGCSFAPRCAHATDRCSASVPPREMVAADHEVRCIRHVELGASPIDERRPAIARTDLNVGDHVLDAAHVTAGYGAQTVLHDVSLTIGAHECLALVGESGSGKSTLAHCIVGLHSSFDGELAFKGQPLARRTRDRDQQVRRQIQYVFQNPYGSLNPRRTIAQNVGQPLRRFYGLSGRELRVRVSGALERAALSATVMDRYPDQLSGGERQRVAIARALACEPSLLICDEITSALDVSVQAAIIELLHTLQQEMGLAMLFVTHNLPLVRSIAQRVAVMSEGRIVELGTVDRVLDAPEADYTRRLLADSPALDALHSDSAVG